MENTIIGVIGAAAGLVGLVMFVRMLIFRLGGEQAVGRVMSSRQDSKGRYIHKVAYQAGEKKVVGEESAGYSQPLSSGAELPLIYSKSVPERFKTAQELRLSLVGFGLLALMGGAFVVRFLIL